MKKFSVSVVIPNYNGMDYLDKLLDSIFSQTIPFDEIIVIDDASTDESVVFVNKKYPQVKIIQNECNIGFAKSVNRGIKSVTSKYVCLLNNDLRIAPNWLEKAMETFELDNNIGAVATNILVDNTNSIIDSQGDDYLIIGTALKRNNLRKEIIDNRKIERVFSACAASAVYDCELLCKIGLFDEFFVSYYEDVDIAFRINLYGYKIMYTPYAVSYHNVSSTYGKTPYMMLFNSYRNEEIVFWANMPARLLWKYFLLRIFFIFCQSVVCLFNGRILVYMKSKIAFMRAFPYVIRKRNSVQKLRVCEAGHISVCLRKDCITAFAGRKTE